MAVMLPAMLLSGLAACSGASAPADAGLTSRTAKLTALAEQDVEAGAPGVVVRVDVGDGNIIQIARQSESTEADHLLTPDDEFRMGSNTKTVVATLVLQLVAENRLGLDDPIETVLPGLIPGGDAITVRMLLNHTSGLFNYVNDPAVLLSFTGQDDRSWTPEQLLAVGVGYPPVSAPGAGFSYSNTNYVALGLALEKLTGQTLADLVEERIAGPLQLEHTYLSAGTARPDRYDSPQLAHGYEPDADTLSALLPEGTPAGTAFAGDAHGGFVDTTWINSSSQWAAGAMVSTAAEWAKFDSALMSGRLIPQAQLDEMQTTVAEDPASPEGNGYGLGIRKVVFPCGSVWGHDGQVGGYNSQTYTDITGTRTATVLTSTVFGLYIPEAGTADRALTEAAVCAMLEATAESADAE
jgi:D-alanyl-D-alanine carboxypeptidase